jgi:hypothetical protein
MRRAGRWSGRTRHQGTCPYAPPRLGYKLANDGHATRAIQAYLGHRTIQNRRALPRWRRRGSRNSFEIDDDLDHEISRAGECQRG